MPSNPNTRRRIVKGGASALIFTSALVFASAARAEWVPLVCETSMGTVVINVDYSAGILAYDGHNIQAVITAQNIEFNYEGPPQHPPSYITSYRNIVYTYRGTINRVSGVANWTRSRENDGVNVQMLNYNGRCRRGEPIF